MSKITKKTSKKLSRSTNDTDIDIHVKEIKYKKAVDFEISSLTIEFSGSANNISFINAIRRVSMDEIPIYAFSSELIKIESNNSIFNNDEMKLRLSQLPILDCDSGLDYLDSKYLNTGLSLNDPDYVKHEKEKLIEIYINSHNNTSGNINITTNDINFIEDGEPKNRYSAKYPILLIQLRPNETFKAHMKAGLSNGLRSSIFSAASNAFYEYDDENKVLFTIESQGQISEYIILNKSINYIIKKLDDFKEYFKNKLKENPVYEKKSTQVFEFENEDHTMGEILNTVFQNNPKIIFSGLSKPSPLERLIKIKISSVDNNPLEYMLEGVDYLKNVYNQILKELEKIKK